MTAREAEIHWRWFQMAISMGSGLFRPFCVILGPKMAPMGSKPIEIAIWNHLQWISASLAVILSGHMTSLRQFWVLAQNWPKMAEKGPKWPKMARKSEKWHPKPSPLDFCSSCGHFEWSHDHFTTILSLRQKLAKNGREGPQMTEMGLKVWKLTSKTISIGFLLLLRSFWVVTWLVCDSFEFGAKIGQKWPKLAKKGPKWLKMAWMSVKWQKLIELMLT